MEEFFSNKGWAKSVGGLIFLIGAIRLAVLWFMNVDIPLWHDVSYIVLGAVMFLASRSAQVKNINKAIGALFLVLGVMAIFGIFFEAPWSFRIFDLVIGAITLFVGLTKE